MHSLDEITQGIDLKSLDTSSVKELYSLSADHKERTIIIKYTEHLTPESRFFANDILDLAKHLEEHIRGSHQSTDDKHPEPSHTPSAR